MGKQLKPLMRQYLQIKRQYPDCILFFRLGDFYEMFFEDAVTAARELDLVLTSREKDSDEPIPMCGVPWFAAEGYIARLVRRGYKVAICEQMEDPAKTRGLVRREVVRIVTPGTFLGEAAAAAEHLASMVRRSTRMAMAFLEPTAGVIWVREWDDAAAPDTVSSLWAQYPVVELIVPETWSPRERARYVPPEQATVAIATVPDYVLDTMYAREVIQRTLGVRTLQPLELEGRPLAQVAVGMILHYLEETQRVPLHHICEVRYLHPESFVLLDTATVRNLELVRNLIDGSTRGTLLEVLDQTMTPMGSRRLQTWILQPLRDLQRIEDRLDAVDTLVHHPTVLEEIRTILRTVPDLSRVVARVGIGTATPRDLGRLRQGLAAVPELRKRLLTLPRRGWLSTVDRISDWGEDVRTLLQRAIVDDPPLHTRDPGFIRDGYHAELDRYRMIARDSKRILIEFEQRERQRTGIPNLRVGYNRVFGYYIEVTKSYLQRVPQSYERRQTLTQAERFTTPELREIEEQILTAEERAAALEQRLFREIVAHVQTCIPVLRTLIEFLTTLDVLAALADVALRHRYVRPVLHTGTTLEIRGGRHPVVETQLEDRPFIPNDLVLDPERVQIIVLTGPNMGGKSTYLRQAALICILAQMGSFVPAESASIGLVDRIFSRVGATDHLVRGQSTFMVEMIETATIVRNATPRSLIILDEIGRGTSTFDGMAIAWAVLEYLHERWQPGPRVLFATHFHELVHLADRYARVRNYAVAVRESGQEITFLYRVVPGPCDRSYGIHVARLAGLPDAIIRRSEEILRELEQLESQFETTVARSGTTSGASSQAPVHAMARQKRVRQQWTVLVQQSLLDQDARYRRLEKIRRVLERLDPDTLSPRQAWEILARLHAEVRDPDES